MSGRRHGRPVAVVGYAHSPIVERFDRPLGAVTVDVTRQAIADAGLTVADVDGFVGSSLLPSAGGHVARDGVSVVSPNWLAARLGATPRFVTGFQGYGQLPGSVTLAVDAIASGSADVVVVHRALYNPPRGYHDNPLTDAAGDLQWTAPQGFFGPLAMIGLAANEYLQRYGATREAFGAVVVEARKNGARIPWSHWHDQPLTLNDYLDAPPVADPICRFDCDKPVDGAAAFVFTTAERARDLPHRPVHVTGVAGSQPARHRLPLHWPLGDIMDAGTAMADRLWTNAGVGPDDVDLPQLYDGFSPFVLLWMEVLGMCRPGEAHRLVLDGGIDSDVSGAMPVLSGGGALGCGRMHGVPQMLECYLQLARRAGDRQRDGVEVAVACHSSPHYGGAVVYSSG